MLTYVQCLAAAVWFVSAFVPCIDFLKAKKEADTLGMLKSEAWITLCLSISFYFLSQAMR